MLPTTMLTVSGNRLVFDLSDTAELTLADARVTTQPMLPTRPHHDYSWGASRPELRPVISAQV